MERLYTADAHLFHPAMLKWFPDSRPFSTIKQMNEMIVENHNARAFKDTDTYIIGDLSVKGDLKELRKLFAAMKGSKHLILGNHDDDEVQSLPWSTISAFKKVKDNGNNIFLSHYPIYSWPGMYSGAFHFFGHTHGKLPSHGRSIDVGVDAWNLCPVNASEAIARMKEWNADFDTYTPERKTVITCAEENVPPDAYEPELHDEAGYGGFTPR